MKFTKPIKTRGLYLVGLWMVSAFVFGNVAGSASAASLLFKPTNGFPYVATGSGGESKLETVGGSTVTSAKFHFEARFLTTILGHLLLKFLIGKSNGEPCGNAPGARSETIESNLTGHLGLAHPGDVPAILLLIPSGFEFKCQVLGGLSEVPIKVRGNVIGRIVSPAVGAEATEMLVSFKQTRGVQEFTTFLKGNEILTRQFEETSINGGAFEQSGQEGHGTLKGGSFLLVSP